MNAKEIILMLCDVHMNYNVKDVILWSMMIENHRFTQIHDVADTQTKNSFFRSNSRKVLTDKLVDWNLCTCRDALSLGRGGKWRRVYWDVKEAKERGQTGVNEDEATKGMTNWSGVHNWVVSACVFVFISLGLPLGHRTNPSLWDWKGNH